MNPPRTVERTGISAHAARLAVTAALRMRRIWWFVARPRTLGVRALPVTPEGRVLLVRHSYRAGWHLPGGGRRRHEDAEAAMLRELREEIGLVHHAAIRQVDEYFHRPDFKRDTVTLFVVEGVQCDPQPSLEIEAIGAFDPDALPEGTSAASRRQIAQWLPGRG